MKDKLRQLIGCAIHSCVHANISTSNDFELNIAIDRTRDKSHGDFACNIALALAKSMQMKPRDLAQKIVDALPVDAAIAKVEIAGPGFINFFLSPHAYHDMVCEILDKTDQWGRSAVGAGKKVMVEFVSANPTGPLHVGHGRGAAYGATLANLLEAAGYDVHREYYVNDAGRQMDILATSVWLRYLELCGEEFPFPANGYKGDYIWDIGASMHRAHGDKYQFNTADVFDNVPADEPAGGDKEDHIDGLIDKARSLLGKEGYALFHKQALDEILDNIRRDLDEFGVVYNEWFSEASLVGDGALQHGIDRLKATGKTYEKDGALWFASSDFGDEKDRVVVRDNGQATYFASDIAYHVNKLERGFDQLINIWGADHHGYIARVKAVLEALGEDANKLDVLLVQFAVLYRGGEKVQMSTRSGEFVTLRELRSEVGNDAARFFYALRKSDQHMDFDLDLAKSQSNDNPVYYIQYAHARICSVFRQLTEKQLKHDPAHGRNQLELLQEQHEVDLMNALSHFPEVVEVAARNHDPHHIAHYLRELSQHFHTYYNAHKFLEGNDALRDARLVLIAATRQVIVNGLSILGVTAPESM
ncbi:MAG: arginine--tRNA ligase [Gammaproteobacteria bacterium]|nr:arginine--tRNA ligase [Gammaproteobacteria bacterium]